MKNPLQSSFSTHCPFTTCNSSSILTNSFFAPMSKQIRILFSIKNTSHNTCFHTVSMSIGLLGTSHFRLSVTCLLYGPCHIPDVVMFSCTIYKLHGLDQNKPTEYCLCLMLNPRHHNFESIRELRMGLFLMCSNELSALVKQHKNCNFTSVR